MFKKCLLNELKNVMPDQNQIFLTVEFSTFSFKLLKIARRHDPAGLIGPFPIHAIKSGWVLIAAEQSL